ncbi:MAG: ABC transporter permease [Bacteroidales bacterium]|nr:ABC transporter permease [Candidatus Cryptobacteroides caccocaballi]
MRFDIDSYKEVFDTLTRNKSRSLLTGFGVFWGLFMLLFMLGGGQGVKAKLMSNFEGFATNSTFLFASETTKPYKGMQEGRTWNLTNKDIERLKIMVPELEVVTPTIAVWGGNAVNGELTASCSIKGVRTEYSRIEVPNLRYGRYINAVDEASARKVCVIGKKIYETLFPDGGDPCGTFIQVGSSYYQIVGVDTNSGNISINGSADETVSIPLTLAQQIYHRGDNVDLICMIGKDGVKMSSLEQRIRKIVAREHLFDETDKPAVYVLNAEEIFTLVDNIFRGVDMLIWLIGLGTLLAGAIGVSNIMMVTVKERTVEIGIRRAIGATPSDILGQIMTESVLLTMVSGLSSIVFTVGILAAVEAGVNDGTPFQIGFGLAVGAALLLTVLGLAAGLAPAMRAMHIKPVDAMRDE